MRLITLKIKHFRNHQESYFEFGEGANILLGDNGQGKTNVLEAISSGFRVKPGMTARGYFTYDLLSNGQRARVFLENRRLPILQKITNLCIPYLKRVPPFRDERVVKCKLFHALSSKITSCLRTNVP